MENDAGRSISLDLGDNLFLFRAAATFQHGPLAYWSNGAITITAS